MSPQKHTLTFFIVLFTQWAFSQFSYGIKGGLNYDSLGELTNTELSTNLEANANTGFHVGLYANVNLLLFYVRPELQFSKSNSSFGENGNISINKIEAPVLLGYKILGPLSVFAGPSFQYILSEKTDRLTLGEIDKNLTVGLQVGTRFKLGRFGVGVRFERGFTSNEAVLLGANNIDISGRIDTRAKQWILSASYALDFSKD
jgi:hypothetical protein